MSRSYRHTPRSGQRKDKDYKKLANRRLRHLPIDSLPLNNKSYRKHTCYYDICDYESVGMSFERYWDCIVKSWYNRFWKYEPFPNRDQVYEEYCRYYLRK